VGVAVVYVACLRTKLWWWWALAVLITFQIDAAYYEARLDFSGSVQSLSNLIYVQGWQQLFDSLERSSGCGNGLQQLGLQPGSADATHAIASLLGDYANILDGGFTFAKFVSEFGAFGLVLGALFVRAVWRAVRELRAMARNPDGYQSSSILARVFVVCYAVELFVRSGILYRHVFDSRHSPLCHPARTAGAARPVEGSVCRDLQSDR
jgi:hypothetical protein